MKGLGREGEGIASLRNFKILALQNRSNSSVRNNFRSTIEGNFFKMIITLGGGVNINCVYYTIFSKVLCLTFCQIPSPYQDSHMQIICVNPADIASKKKIIGKKQH